MQLLFVLAALPSIVLVSARTDWGKCPDIDVVHNFDIGRYLGDWYEVTKIPMSFEKGLRCVMANYSIGAHGKVKITNSGLKNDNSTQVVLGEAYQPKYNEGLLKLRFSKFAPYGNYQVIKTDYDNYTLIHSCTDFGVFNVNMFWILVRDRSYATDENMKPLLDFAENAGVKTQHLVPTDVHNCFDH